MNNGDRIRKMSDEELARFLCNHMLCSRCPALMECNRISDKGSGAIASWLKQEAKDE